MEKPKSDHPLEIEIEFGTPNPNPNPNPKMGKKRPHHHHHHHLLLPDSSSPNPDYSMENPNPTSSYPEGFAPFDALFAEFMEESKAKRMKMTVEEQEEEEKSSSSSSSSSSSPTSILQQEASLILTSLSLHKGQRLVLLKPPPHLPPSAEARLAWAVEDLKQMMPCLSRELKLSPSGQTTATQTHARSETPPHHHISKLKRIVQVLKKMDSSLRRDSSSTSPPSREEQRLYNLILCSVNTCIFLFYREITNEEEEEKQQGEDQVDDEGQPDDAESVADKVDELITDYCLELPIFLQDCRPSITPPEEDPLRHPHPQVQEMFEDDTLQREQQLLGILRDLDEMGRSRDYAPPNKGHEIECYNKIRDLITCSLLFVEANIHLQISTSTPDTCKWDSIPRAPQTQSDQYVPDGHRFALALDLMPVFRSLVKKCRQHASSIFLTTDTTSSYRTKHPTLEDEGGGGGEEEEEANVGARDNAKDDIDTGGVDNSPTQVRNSRRAVVMKSRLECLRLINSAFTGMRSIPCNSPPSNKEVRLYAQIIEHVHSSIWLSMTSRDEEKITGTGSPEVNVANVISASAVAATEGNYENTREQYLLEIVSYLNAMKSSCLAAVPTQEEVKYYWMLSQGLDYSFMSCPVAADHGVEGAGADRIKSQLVSIYKRELDFVDEAKAASASIINMVRRAIMPDEGELASSEDAFNWLEENNVPLADKLKAFFRGRIEQLDQLIVNLEEMCILAADIVERLSDATKVAGWSFRGRKAHAIVVRELDIARYIMNKIDRPISGII